MTSKYLKPIAAQYAPAPQLRWSLLAFLARALPRAVPFAFAAALIFVVISYFIPPRYASTARFTINTAQESPTGGLAALARQSGLSLSQGGAEGSLDYWQQIVAGRAVRELVLARGLDVRRSGGNQHIDLIKWYHLEGLRGDTAREAALSALARNLSAGVDSRANILSLVATDRDPVVAAALAAATLEELNAFNTETRQSKARQNRVFVEQRLRDANTDAIQAQERLTGFYTANRNYQSSPALVATEARVRRDAENKAQVYQTLVLEFEQARIQEARDLPALTVIERPVPAIRRVSPNRPALLFMGLILGTALALLLTAWSDWKTRIQADGQHRELLMGALGQSRLGRRMAKWIVGPTSTA
jgi:uncharacterized protein involved in exopolysaccharide biosynthesis